MKKRQIEEAGRSIPVIEQCDILVCGGGPAGCAAALAAAREGMDVCLIEKDCSPGGLATNGLIAFFLTMCDGRGHQVIGGIAEEFFRAAIQFGPGRIPECWQEGGDPAKRVEQRLTAEFNPFWFMLCLEKLLVEAGVNILYDTRLCTVCCHDGRVEGVLVENKSGRGAILCKAAIDATGDADLCALCGEETVSLDSNRRAAWFYSHNGGKLKLHVMGDIFYLPVPEGSPTFSGDDYRDVTRSSIDSRTVVRKTILELRQQEATKDLVPVALPSIPLLRKTRRLKGLCEICEEDENRFREDAVGMTGYYRKAGLLLYFPYGCLIGKTGNILAAGRCISSREEFAWNITRGITSSSITGQAAGTAAALAVKGGVTVQELDIKLLQETLRRNGVIIRSPQELL